MVIAWTILRSQHYHQVIAWDAFGYYLYLPAIFIHGDVSIMDPTWFHALFETYSPSATIYQINYMDDGGRAIKYPIGLAILWAPYFAIAHGIAGLLDMPQDGMSRPYHWSLITGSWAYFALGLLWLRKVLLTSFPDRITALTLLVIVFGSNLLYMVALDPLMPHAFLYTLYAGIIWYSIRWHQRPGKRASIFLGALLGLAALVRNTEVIAIMIPLFWGVWDTSIQDHLKRLWRHRLQLLFVAVTMAIVCLPQLLYWKEVTGKYFYIGYTNAGEGLDLLSPHIMDVLFSYRKGLVIYTPIVVLALLGIWGLRKYMRASIPAIPMYLLVNFLIVSSWTIWWYADSYGNRGFVQSYAALSIPLAALLQWGHVRIPKVRSMLAAGLVLLVFLNLFQTWQAGAGILHTSRMTKEAYWAIFGRTSPPLGSTNY